VIARVAEGSLPAKHHIAFRDAGGALRWEECITRQGFDGAYTIAYHERRPHEQRVIPATHGYAAPIAAPPRSLAKRHYEAPKLPASKGPAVDVRTPILFNGDLTLSIVSPTEDDPVYVSNGDGDELFFIHEGSGTLRSQLGDLRFGPKDYVAIPKGILHRFVLDAGVKQRWLAIETQDLRIPSKWRNEIGQLRMDAPYCHRDFKSPDFRGPMDEGVRELVVKRDGRFHGFSLRSSPLDVVGWDVSVYPFVFPVLAFQPRAGLVHLPPDWHGTFACKGALICSFVPRTVDFHPESIPCPYPHSSVDCDEFIYYVEGNFISRRGIGSGSMSYHPMGIPHGPHPGAYEASVGHKATNELAVMLDTLRTLHDTEAARAIEDAGYHDSFVS
jgi:homogentisate 1,2-dioxygenase